MTPKRKARVHLGQNGIEWLILALAMSLIGAICTYFVWTEKQIVMSSDVDRMTSQVRIIDENLVRQLTGVRNALDKVRSNIKSAHNEKLIHTSFPLGVLKEALPGVRAIAVLNDKGHILLSADDLGDKRLDDSVFMKSIDRMKDPKRFYIGAPYEFSPGASNIKVALVTEPTVNWPRYIVIAILNPEYFNVVMRSVLYAKDMNSAITEENGSRLLFVPYNEKTISEQTVFPTSLIYRHIHSGRQTTVLTGASTLNSENRLIVQRTIDQGDINFDHSLVVSLSRSLDAMQAPWKRLSIMYALIWIGASSFSAILLFFIQKKRKSFAAIQVQREFEQKQNAERIELALRGADLGLWDWDILTGRLDIDERSNHLLGFDKTVCHLLYSEWLELIHPDDVEEVERVLRSQIENTQSFYELEYRVKHHALDWIWLQSRGKILESNKELGPIRMIGTWMDITDKKRSEHEIEHLAFFDGLTNLPNRRLFHDRLERALANCKRNKQHCALLFIDLDNFKDLNDTLGHGIGDRLLVQVAQRLHKEIRGTDTVARLGGDEFVVLFEGLGNNHAEATYYVESITQKLVKSLRQQHVIDGYDVYSTPSIGITLFGNSEESVDEILKRADVAMYEAKAAGRNTFKVFTPQMQDNVVKETAMEVELRHAIARNELELHYQPIFDGTKRLVGAEALIRWNHPTRGTVPPLEFIPFAERTGLIIEIGQWVVEHACAQLSEWSRSPATRQLSIAVNVSARQFRQIEFVSDVLGAIYEHEIAPQSLKIELTESMLLNDLNEVVEKIRSLKDKGVGFSLDDFGTGYSSLSYLKNIPFDQLKIDRSFIQDILNSKSDAAIAQAIINLAHSLNLKVIAEGVESKDQKTFLAVNGCDLYQGFFFGKPQPIDDFSKQFINAKT